MARSRPVIAMVGSFPPPFYGSNVSFQRVMSSNIREEFDVHHVDTSDHRTSENVGRFDITNVLIALRAVLSAARIALFRRPGILYICIAQSPPAYLRDGLMMLATKALCPRTKIVVHLRGSYFAEFHRRSNALLRGFIDASMATVSRAIVLGECLRDNFTRWLPAEHIDVVANGTTVQVDVTGKFDGVLDERPLRVLYLSTLVASKGIVDTIEAVREFRLNRGPIELRYAGERGVRDPLDGSDGDSLLATIVRLASDGAVRDAFHDLGIVSGSAKEQALRWADLLVLPTYYPLEGLPNAILEGMAAGCAIISTRHAAIPEVVIHGVTGVLVAKRSPADITASLAQLDGDRPALARMMRASFERYRTCYTADVSNTNLIRVLASIAHADATAGEGGSNG